ncbi:armadillo-type protein, partial [Mycena galericulata]
MALDLIGRGSAFQTLWSFSPPSPMQDLTRQQSRTSLLSWWSDSNPPGATISIHAAAKPLMRFMYHRQALDLIRSNRRFALTSSMLETYSAYVFCKYVSPATKAEVLRELKARSRAGDACGVITSQEVVFNQLTELAGATNVVNEIRLEACGLLGNIAGSPAPTHSQRVGICARLFSLLHDRDDSIATEARQALSYAVSSGKVMDAVMDAQGLNYFGELLASPNTDVRDWTRGLLVEIAFRGDEHADPVKLYTWILSVLRGNDPDFIQGILPVLTGGRKGVEEGVTAKIVDYIPDLLASPSTEVLNLTWELLKDMVDYLSTAQLAFHKPLRGVPISVLCDYSPGNSDRDCAESTFSAVTDLWLDNPQYVAIEAEVLDGVVELLGARPVWIRVNSCKLAGALASHYSTKSPILQLKVCKKLVSVLRSTQSYSCLEASIYALCQISRSARGLRVVIEAKTLENLLELLERPLGMLPAGYCELLGALASVELDLQPAVRLRLASLLRGLDENVQTGLTALLGNTEIQPWTWWLVLRLVDREGSERPSDKRTLTTGESRLKKSLDSSHEHPPAPLQVARWLNPDSDTRRPLINLAKSSNTEVQKWTVWLRERLAHDDPLWDEPL